MLTAIPPIPPIHTQTLEPRYDAPDAPIAPALALIGIGLVLAVVLGATLHRRRTAHEADGEVAPIVQPAAPKNIPSRGSLEVLAQVAADPSLELDLSHAREK